MLAGHVARCLLAPGRGLAPGCADGDQTSAPGPLSARYKRLARDYERLAISLQQFRYLAFVGLMLAKAIILTCSQVRNTV